MKTQKGSRWHPPRISGIQKQIRAREANKPKEDKRPKTKMFDEVKKVFNQSKLRDI